MSLKTNFLVVPITLLVVLIVTIILAACKVGWDYYLIGAMVGLLNHGLLVKQTARITRYAKLDPEGQTLNPKRTSLLGYLLRVIVFAGVFIALVYRADIASNKGHIWYIITALAGYMTPKVILLICFALFREKVTE